MSTKTKGEITKVKVYSPEEIEKMQRVVFVSHNFWDKMTFPYSDYKIEIKDEYAIITKV